MEPLAADDPRMIGDFRISARLGSGGMGRVFLGFSLAGRPVAVKIIHPELARDKEFVSRFRVEVAAAQAVGGIFTAPVVAVGWDDDPPWLATAFVAGPTLQAAVDVHGPLAEPALWRLTAGLTEALASVHRAGLVHRDLKPTNVLLAEDGPRLIDFGVSRALEGARLTSAGMTVGTPPYMSPEQAEGQSAGLASDVFALASVICFAATGNPPFGDGSPAAVLYRVVHAQPALSDVPEPLRDLIAPCLAKAPSQRPTLAELTAASIRDAHGPAAWRASFWPPDLTAIIEEYRTSLGALALRAAPDGTSARRTATAPGRSPAAEPAGPEEQAAVQTQTITSAPALPREPNEAPAGDTAQGGQSSGFARRRALAALGGLAAAGLGYGAWEIARSESSPVITRRSQRAPGPQHGQPRTATLVWSKAALLSPSATNLFTPSPLGPDMPANLFAASGTVGVNDTTEASTGPRTTVRVISGAGRNLWSRTLDTSNGVVGAGGSVLVTVSGYGNLAGLNAVTGRTAWASGSPGEELHAEIAADTAYILFANTVNNSDVGMYTVNTKDGSVKWMVRTGYSPSDRPLTAGNGSVYVASAGGTIYSVNARSGNRQWSHTSQVTSFSQLTIASSVVCACGYTRAGSTLLLGLDADTGRLAWTAETTSGGIPWMLASGGTVLSGFRSTSFNSVPALTSTAVARDGRSGKILWTRAVPAGLYAGPTAFSGTFCLGDGAGAVHGISVVSGHLVWSYRANGAIVNLAASEDLVYALTSTGSLFALRP